MDSGCRCLAAFRPRTGARRVWSGYDAAPERISQSIRVPLLTDDGDAGCKYIELSVLVLVCNTWWVNVADGLLRWSTARGQQSRADQGLLSERGEPAAVEGA
jgi:hypothetical protein